MADKTLVGVKFSISGFSHLLKRLDAVKRSVRNKHLRRALTKSGRVVAKAVKNKLKARRTAAVEALGKMHYIDESGRKRKLSRAQQWAVLKQQGTLEQTIKAVVRVNDKRKKIYCIIGADADETLTYSRPVNLSTLLEYGHGGKHGPARPFPFIRPAFDETKSEVQAIIRDELERGLVSEMTK